MRIGVLHQYGLLTSGSGIYAVRLVERLRGHRHHVCLISRDAAIGDERHLEKACAGDESPSPVSGACRCYALVDGPSAVAYPRPEAPYAPTFAALGDDELQAWLTYQIDAITQIATAERLDVLHANHEVPMAFVAREVSRRTGIPCVVVAHGSTLEYVCAADARYASLTRLGLEGAARVVALTPELRERLLRVAPAISSRLEVVPVGVDLDVFRCDPSTLAGIGAEPPELPTVAYVGRMSLEKGVHALIAAFPEVVHQVPNARLQLIGDGPSRKPLEAVALALADGDLAHAETILRSHVLPGKENWLEPVLAYWHGAGREQASVRARALKPGSLSFAGRLDTKDVAVELRRARVVVVPSLIREGFPLITLGAIASGIPPVCADHGGLSAVLDALEPALGEAGRKLRVPLGRTFVTDLAGRIVDVLRLLDSPARRAVESLHCRALAVERYGWERVAADIEAQYRAARETNFDPGAIATGPSVRRPPASPELALTVSPALDNDGRPSGRQYRQLGDD